MLTPGQKLGLGVGAVIGAAVVIARRSAAAAQRPADMTFTLDQANAAASQGSGGTIPTVNETVAPVRGNLSIQTNQQDLAQLGYDPGPIDGRWGPQTASAIRDFQRAQGLYVSGIFDLQTTQAIANALDAAGLASSASTVPLSGISGNAPFRDRVQVYSSLGSAQAAGRARRRTERY